MTALAARLNQPAVTLGAFEKMTGIADFFVYAEMLFTLEMAVAEPAGDLYSVNHIFDVDLVGEFHAAVDEILCLELLVTVALRPHTGVILNCGVGFCADSADHTGHGLGQAVYFALDISLESGLQMTVEAVYLRMTRIFPAGVVSIHDVAGIAEARLARYNYRPAAEDHHDYDQQGYPDGPFHLLYDVYRRIEYSSDSIHFPISQSQNNKSSRLARTLGFTRSCRQLPF
jgi:hypothetical protein